MHGGATPRGRASVHFKHGRYSKDLPARLAGRYEEALKDEELLSMRKDIALVDARLGELLEKIDTGEAGAVWRALQNAYRRYVTARAMKDALALITATNQMGALIEQGADEQLTWHEIGTTLDRRRRLAESERKRLVDMRQMITSERAMLLLTAVVDVIRSNVDDPKTLGRITNELSRLMAVGAGEPVGAKRVFSTASDPTGASYGSAEASRRGLERAYRPRGKEDPRNPDVDDGEGSGVPG